jgi:hypothetical protein
MPKVAEEQATMSKPKPRCPARLPTSTVRAGRDRAGGLEAAHSTALTDTGFCLRSSTSLRCLTAISAMIDSSSFDRSGMLGANRTGVEHARLAGPARKNRFRCPTPSMKASDEARQAGDVALGDLHRWRRTKNAVM